MEWGAVSYNNNNLVLTFILSARTSSDCLPNCPLFDWLIRCGLIDALSADICIPRISLNLGSSNYTQRAFFIVGECGSVFEPSTIFSPAK